MRAASDEPKDSTPRRWILFALTVPLFLCSLLTVLSAPTAALWIVAIVAGEWGHFAAILSAILAVLSFGRTRLARLTRLLAVLATALFLSPAFRAAKIAAFLPAQCASAFGKANNQNGREVPFSARSLFRRAPRSDVTVTEHLYAMEKTKQLDLDLYQANGTSLPQPLIVMIHGGSWKGGSKAQLPAINRYLAHQGYSVAAINYRRAPKFKSPAAVEDTFRAIEFLKANAERLRLDPSRIVLIGRSAGGQIALAAAYASREPGIRGVVGFYAPADMVLGYNEPSRRLVLDSKKVLEDYVGGSPAENPQGYATASAINFVNPSTPATLLIHGELDPIVWPKQSEMLSARLKQAGRPQLYLSLP